MGAVVWPWPLLCASLPFLFSSLILVLLVGVATLLLEYVRRTERDRRSNASSEAFFEDPNSMERVAFPSIFDAADKFLSLVIPAFNEEDRLPGALDETMEYLQKRAELNHSFSYEVIVVDDGSTDGTLRIALDFVRKYTIDVVRVFPLGKNCGKGEAIRNGMLHARGELLLMLDADGATKVSDLEKLEHEIKNLADKDIQAGKGADNGLKLGISDVAVAVFGSRAHLEKQALATRKWYRNLLMKGFHFVVLLTAGSGIKDTQCGFKMFTRTAARKLFSNMRLKRWCFDVELVYLCKKFKIPMAEISVNWSEISGSKVRLTSILHMLFELVLIRVGYGLGIWKIHP